MSIPQHTYSQTCHIHTEKNKISTSTREKDTLYTEEQRWIKADFSSKLDKIIVLTE